MLRDRNISFRRNKLLVRGLDYYSGTCFEIKLQKDGGILNNGFSDVLGESQNTLLAGGRYDSLAMMFAADEAKAAPVPSIGWAAGIDRLVLLLQA
jgi:histidyl-tRNA synthetase